MMQLFRTRVPYRHDHLVDVGEERPPLSRPLRTSKPVRPARLVFQSEPVPRTEQVAAWIRDHDPRRREGGTDRHKPPFAPFVYRGEVAAAPREGEDVAVHLWEEPSGRPLDARLPRGWLEQVDPYKGMPFRMVTWMIEEEGGAAVPRCRLEMLGAVPTEDGK